MQVPGKNFVNTVLRLTVNFRNENGDDVDPATITFRLMSPCGSESTFVFGTNPEIQKSSVGDYTADVTPTESGRWHFRWQTTGSGTTFAIEGDFLVQHSAFYDGVRRAYS